MSSEVAVGAGVAGAGKSGFVGAELDGVILGTDGFRGR